MENWNLTLEKVSQIFNVAWWKLSKFNFVFLLNKLSPEGLRVTSKIQFSTQFNSEKIFPELNMKSSSLTCGFYTFDPFRTFARLNFAVNFSFTPGKLTKVNLNESSEMFWMWKSSQYKEKWTSKFLGFMRWFRSSSHFHQPQPLPVNPSNPLWKVQNSTNLPPSLFSTCQKTFKSLICVCFAFFLSVGSLKNPRFFLLYSKQILI